MSNNEWLEISQEEMTDADGNILEYDETQCDFCQRFTGWQDNGFTHFFRKGDKPEQDTLCIECYINIIEKGNEQ